MKLSDLSRAEISEKILDIILSISPRDTCGIISYGQDKTLCVDGEDLNAVAIAICSLSMPAIYNSIIVLRKCARDILNNPNYKDIDIAAGTLLLILSLKNHYFPKSYLFTPGELKKLASHTKITKEFYIDHLEVLSPFYNELAKNNEDINNDSIKLMHVLEGRETSIASSKAERINNAKGRWSLHGKAYTKKDIVENPTSFDWPELYREGRNISELTKEIYDLVPLSIITMNLLRFIDTANVNDYLNEETINMIRNGARSKLRFIKISDAFEQCIVSFCYLKGRNAEDIKVRLQEYLNYANNIHSMNLPTDMIKRLCKNIKDYRLTDEELVVCCRKCTINARDISRTLASLDNHINEKLLRKGSE